MSSLVVVGGGAVACEYAVDLHGSRCGGHAHRSRRATVAVPGLRVFRGGCPVLPCLRYERRARARRDRRDPRRRRTASGDQRGTVLRPQKVASFCRRPDGNTEESGLEAAGVGRTPGRESLFDDHFGDRHHARNRCGRRRHRSPGSWRRRRWSRVGWPCVTPLPSRSRKTVDPLTPSLGVTPIPERAMAGKSPRTRASPKGEFDYVIGGVGFLRTTAERLSRGLTRRDHQAGGPVGGPKAARSPHRRRSATS